MFLTDVMEHLQTMNLQLQGKDKIISDLSRCIFNYNFFKRALKIKHFVIILELKKNSNIKQEKLNEYIKNLEGILTEFQNRFQDMKYFKLSLNFFLNHRKSDTGHKNDARRKIHLRTILRKSNNTLQVKNPSNPNIWD